MKVCRESNRGLVAGVPRYWFIWEVHALLRACRRNSQDALKANQSKSHRATSNALIVKRHEPDIIRRQLSSRRCRLTGTPFVGAENIDDCLIEPGANLDDATMPAKSIHEWGLRFRSKTPVVFDSTPCFLSAIHAKGRALDVAGAPGTFKFLLLRVVARAWIYACCLF